MVYKGDAGYLSDGEKAALEAFVKRGGGLVSLHDSLCGPDPAYLSKLVGGAKKHGEVNYTLDATIPYTVVDKTNPIMKDMSNLTLLDEAFFMLTWAKDPDIHVLATAEIAPTRSAGEHKGESRAADLDLRAHSPRWSACSSIRLDAGPHLLEFRQLSDPANLLRGIAWAGKKPVDELIDYVAPPRPTRSGIPPANGPR